MMEAGKQIRCMEKESKHSRMETGTKEALIWIREKERENTYG